MRKLTKIVATVSDLNCEPEFIEQLKTRGVNVIRMNTAHQTHEDTLKIVNNVRACSERLAIMVDTKGPEVRTSKTANKIQLKKGNTIKIKSNNFEELSTNEVIQVSYSGFVEEIPLNESILIDDGELELVVKEKTDTELICEIMNDGEFSSKKSVNIPGVHLKLPSLTEKDIGYVEFACKHDLDFIAHSFVRNKFDVLEIQKILDKNNSKAKIIAKIENREGVDNIQEILTHVYGVMIARGDLAIEIPAAEVPAIQKSLIKACVIRGKPVITATQMLHTMIKNPRPTRAEINDVANAVYDGSSAVMLSGETAYGDYPLEAVEMMTGIIADAEKHVPEIQREENKHWHDKIQAYMAKGVANSTKELPVKAIIAATREGRTVRIISSYRSKVPCYARTNSMRTVRELALVYGAYASYFEDLDNHDKLIESSLKYLVSKRGLNEEDLVVITGNSPDKVNGSYFIEVKTIKGTLEKYGRE